MDFTSVQGAIQASEEMLQRTAVPPSDQYVDSVVALIECPATAPAVIMSAVAQAIDLIITWKNQRVLTALLTAPLLATAAGSTAVVQRLATMELSELARLLHYTNPRIPLTSLATESKMWYEAVTARDLLTTFYTTCKDGILTNERAALLLTALSPAHGTDRS